eukprot:gene6500-4682_t
MFPLQVSTWLHHTTLVESTLLLFVLSFRRSLGAPFTQWIMPFSLTYIPYLFFTSHKPAKEGGLGGYGHSSSAPVQLTVPPYRV